MRGEKDHGHRGEDEDGLAVGLFADLDYRSKLWL